MNSFLFEPTRRGRRSTPVVVPYRHESWNATQDLAARYSAIWKGSRNPARPSLPPRWHYGGPDSNTTYE